MHKTLIFVVLVFLSGVAGCIFSMNDDYDKGVGGGSYTITGKFVHKNDSPIVGLTVQLKGDSTVTAVTDSNGEYIFENVSPGSYIISPGDKGHSSKSILVTNSNVTIGTNSDGHGSNINGDYSCSGCHKN